MTANIFFGSDVFLWSRWGLQAEPCKTTPPMFSLHFKSTTATFFLTLLLFNGLFALKFGWDVILMGVSCQQRNETSLYFIYQPTCAVWMLTFSRTLCAWSKSTEEAKQPFIACMLRIVKVPLLSKTCFYSCSCSWMFELHCAEWRMGRSWH